GMQSHELGDPVLLLDQIDHHVTARVLPVLAPRASYELAEDTWVAAEPGKSLAAAAGAAVRGELVAQLGPDAEAASQIATLLGERGALVDDWAKLLDRRGWTMPEVEELFVPDTLLQSLDGQVPDFQIRRVREIDEE